MPTSPISPVAGIALPEITRVSTAGKPGEFGAVLAQAVQSVERERADAAGATEAFLTGESEDLHTAALATQRAELSLELFLQTRNKVVQAYQEIMRMQM